MTFSPLHVSLASRDVYFHVTLISLSTSPQFHVTLESHATQLTFIYASLPEKRGHIVFQWTSGGPNNIEEGPREQWYGCTHEVGWGGSLWVL